MIIKEYRITLPLTVEEYQIGQLYSVAEVSKNESGGGEGVEVLKNEPFSNVPLLGGKYKEGQYTYKIYHVASKVPSFIRRIAPKGSLEIHEEAWNAYPYCRTLLTNPAYMKENFFVAVESLHLADRGELPNVHELPPEKLSQRDVVVIDISNDPISADDFDPNENPATFHSQKTGRGPLNGDWMQTVKPVMTCYKLVTVEFKWFGLQSRVENLMHKSDKRIFTIFHRKLFCWIDQWHGLTIEQIRNLERQTKEVLDSNRNIGEVRGMRASD